MTEANLAAKLVAHKPKHKLRSVAAASLFDGHDASINIMQATGAEVIQWGHNRSVGEIVNAQRFGALGQIGTVLFEVGGQFRRSM